MQKILFVCNDFIGNSMAGPGIRYWEMARALERKGHTVVVLSRYLEKDFLGDGSISVGKASFFNLIRWTWRSNYVVQTGRPLSILLSFLFHKKIIFDQYDPVIFEFLQRKPVGFVERLMLGMMLFMWKIRQRLILRFGGRFLVANEKQMDLLIGQMTILGHAGKLASVTILPFGLPKAKPCKNRKVIRGSKIKETDFLLVWGGGIWEWFDPFTLLEALSKLAAQRDDIKVYFPGINPPNPDSRKLAITDDFINKAGRLGLLDTVVIVNSGWTNYAERADYLLEADAGISLHHNSLETRFAFRTRMLDYLWAGLPIIASKGDSWADIIDQKGLGITVDPEDVNGVANAIVKIAGDQQFRNRCKEHVQTLAADYEWNKLTEKLILD
jgi:glycosyltransferase involved in cell wall biosynthesis